MITDSEIITLVRYISNNVEKDAVKALKDILITTYNEGVNSGNKV